MIKIGILGGGQLGYMFLQNALQYPCEISILDPAADAPCAPHAHHFVQGDFKDYDTVVKFGENLDAIGIEIEHVNVDALRYLKSIGKKVVPDPEALAIIQDKGVQKEFYVNNNIPTAPYFELNNWEDFKNLETVTYPIFQKSKKDGYDGKGVQFLKSETDLSKMLQAPSIFETPADLDREIAVVTVADHLGNIVTYPTVEFVMNEEYNLLDYLLIPSSLSKEVTDRAEKNSKRRCKRIKFSWSFCR